MPNEFDSLIASGMGAVKSSSTAGEAFTLSGQAGTFYGVFRGDQTEVDFMSSGGHDSDVTNRVSVLLSDLSSMPTENEVLTCSNGTYIVTAAVKSDNSTVDLDLRKLAHGEGD